MADVRLCHLSLLPTMWQAYIATYAGVYGMSFFGPDAEVQKHSTPGHCLSLCPTRDGGISP